MEFNARWPFVALSHGGGDARMHEPASQGCSAPVERCSDKKNIFASARCLSLIEVFCCFSLSLGRANCFYALGQSCIMHNKKRFRAASCDAVRRGFLWPMRNYHIFAFSRSNSNEANKGNFGLRRVAQAALNFTLVSTRARAPSVREKTLANRANYRWFLIIFRFSNRTFRFHPQRGLFMASAQWDFDFYDAMRKWNGNRVAFLSR